jgi:hypothetical protein
MEGQRAAAVNRPRFAFDSRGATGRSKREVQTTIRIYGHQVRQQGLAGDFNALERRFLPPQAF